MDRSASMYQTRLPGSIELAKQNAMARPRPDRSPMTVAKAKPNDLSPMTVAKAKPNDLNPMTVAKAKPIDRSQAQ